MCNRTHAEYAIPDHISRTRCPTQIFNIIKMSIIIKVHARQILDSRGNPTIEVDVVTENGVLGRAAVPSGASTGEHEAVELRDGGKAYMGKGVLKAVENVNAKIAPELMGVSVFEQNHIDQLMIDLDGTANKSNLGANAILGVSLAVAKAAANELGLPLYRYVGGVSANTLPVPMMNIINGGSHSDAPIAFQEFMIMPVKAQNFTHAMQMGTEIFHNLKKVLHDRDLSTAVGDEGGFAPNLAGGTEDALDTIKKAVENAGYKFGDEVMIALDCAASEFYVDGKYDYTKFEGATGKVRTSKEQAEYLASLAANYPIISIEDGCAENDWDGWKILTDKLASTTQLVGDDLFVTNAKILREGIKRGVANSCLIKVNQIGTLTETFQTVEVAKRAGYIEKNELLSTLNGLVKNPVAEEMRAQPIRVATSPQLSTALRTELQTKHSRSYDTARGGLRQAMK